MRPYLVALMLALLCWPGRGHAFSDPAKFAAPATEGGGAGRYFTGAPRDPYSCSVCHRSDAAEPSVVLEGLPTELVPNQTYQGRIRWDDIEASHALTLELSRADGSTPSLDLPFQLENAPAEQRCDASADSDPAVSRVDIADRRVLVVRDCGALELTFQFTAPDEPRVLLSVGIVRSDGMGDLAGDGVLEIRRVLPRAGEPTAGCQVSIHSAREGPLLLVFLAFAGLLRRAQRKRNPMLTLISNT